MGIDRLCNAALAQPLRRPCISINGVFSCLQMSKHLRRRYSHMAAIISRTHGVSKHSVTSCCPKATDLLSVQQSVGHFCPTRASHPEPTAESGELPEICDEPSRIRGRTGGTDAAGARSRPALRRMPAADG